MVVTGRFVLLLSISVGTCLSATVVRGPGNSTVSVGQTASFTCTVTTDWEIITWSLRGNPVVSETRTGSIISDPRLNHSYTSSAQGDISTVTISRVVTSDTGSVNCGVHSNLGFDSKDAYLIVQEESADQKDWLIIAIAVPLAAVVLLAIIILIIVICRKRARRTSYTHQNKTRVPSKNPVEIPRDGQMIAWVENSGIWEEDMNSVVNYTGSPSLGYTDKQSQQSSRTVLNNTSETQYVVPDRERQWPILNQPVIVPKNTKHVTAV
eukprot:gi/632986837/ref/XP_007910460.1/ PREDICTED: uncharacterized protein LOC103191287 [Callorhinchus milii]